MNLEFFNSPSPQAMDAGRLPNKPEFALYEPDFAMLKKYQEQFQKYKNILIIAHGGSITSLYGYYHALNYEAHKKVYFLSTTDPDYIYQLKHELKKEETLVIPISKSGKQSPRLKL